MNIPFTKMNGAGNDFVMLDNRSGSLKLSREQIAHLCDRHAGIGADGLLLVEPAPDAQSDFRMRYYNSDGGEAEMCGNGARCFARFVQKIAKPSGSIRFQTLAGIITADFDGALARVNLSEPKDLKLNQKVSTSAGELEVHSLNTGVPHAVIFVPDADKAMVGPLGAELRYHAHFAPKGTNVNFVQLLGGNAIRVRTYERGVEGETLACGTGVTASALIAQVLHKLASPVRVTVQSGDNLEVTFRRDDETFRDVHLKGPADFTFQGVIEID